jgi:hypothetical protein
MKVLETIRCLKFSGMGKYVVMMFFLSFLTISTSPAQDEELKVFSTQGKTWLRFSNVNQALNLHLAKEAEKLLAQRDERVAQITTTAALEARQREIGNILDKLITPQERSTPLNPTITKTVKKKDFTMELVVFESLPGFYVTGALFIPDEFVKPAPAILFCSGHSAAAFRRDIYQQPLLNLVKKGFVVLAIDPIGQGERLQYLDPNTGESLIGSSTKEHSYPMAQTALIGRSVAEYFVLDGIRAIDYLVSRPEVDPSRIGVHGLSGGGTQTAFIAAIDKRVKAAAPSGYITNYRRIFESIGVQDGEQNIYRGLLNGIDHPELLLARVPKPTLIMATTRDFFSIEGTRETYDELKRYYDILGKADNIDLVEGDYGHGYTQNIREAMYSFFQKHLDNPGDSAEEEVEFLEEGEITVTPTGQVSTAFNSKNIFDLNRERAMVNLNRLAKERANHKGYLEKVTDLAQTTSGYKAPEGVGKPFFMGRSQREGYAIEKYFIEGEGEYAVPYLLFLPRIKNSKAILYLHSEGKQAEAAIGGEIERLVNKGFTVLAPDLLGIGEQEPLDLRGDANIQGVSFNAWFSGMTIGRSILGIRAGDISRLVQVLKQEGDVEEIHGVAKNEIGPVMLHAAAFDPLFTSVACIGSYVSWEAVILNEFYKTEYLHSMVPGALLHYDLPDLASALAPNKLMMIGLKDSEGANLEEHVWHGVLSPLFQAYEAQGALHRLKIAESSPEHGMDLLMDFIEQ